MCQAAFHQAGINSIHESLDLSTLLFMYSIRGTRPHTTSICSNSCNSIVVSPVTDDNASSVSIYLPHDRFYEFCDVIARRRHRTICHPREPQPHRDPDLHLRWRGPPGALHVKGAITTTELHTKHFLALGTDGKAVAGRLNVDDGASISQKKRSRTWMTFVEGGRGQVGRAGLV